MKLQFLTIVLSLCLCTSSMSYAWQENSSSQEEILTEKTASELVTCDSTIPTPQEIYAAMTALQDQDAYKEGTTWNNEEPYSDTKGYYRWKGGPLDGTNIVAVGCVAFAFILSDAAFDSLPARMYAEGSFAYEDIKVGDILRVDGDTHTVIVLEVSDAGVIVAEGNYNDTVHWGRPMSKDEVMRDTSHYITRYPEDYISPDDPSAGELLADGTLTTGLTWNLTKAGTLTVSGSGAMPEDFSGPSEQPWYAYSGQIRQIIIEEGVTSIGSSAFYGNAALSVEIPNSVTTIGNNAFRESSLIYAGIPSGVRTVSDDAFRECPNLTSVTVSEGVETIGQRAFQGCTKLASADFPASMKEIGAGTFYNCTELLRVTFASGGDQVKMGDDLFAGCWRLSDVTLPSNINYISTGMFQNCYASLYRVSIPQGAAKIGNSAFASCSALTALIIPDSVTDIEMAAFSACQSLTDIYFTGTEAQWESIWKAADVKVALENVAIHYEYIPEPSEPDTPSEPSEPSEPETPSEPSEPSEPETPSEPSGPSEPETPSETPKPETTPKPAEPSITEPGTESDSAVPGTTIPFIRGESGKEGWEAIKETITNASEGKQVSINMNGASTVPGHVFDSVKGQNVVLSFDMGNGITWLVNGRDITADRVNDINLSVQVGTSDVPRNLVDEVAGDRQTTQVSLAHSGEFGYSAVLMINVDSANAGLYANLFYYNENTGRLEFVVADKIDESGYAELVFTHASSYVIVIGSDIMGGTSGGVSPKTGEFDDGIHGPDAAEMQEEGGSLKLLWMLVAGAGAMAVAGIVIFLVQNKVNKQEQP